MVNLDGLSFVASSSALFLNVLGTNPPPKAVTLASHTMPLNDRYNNKMVNDVFKDNILLTMAYMEKRVKNPKEVNWNEVEKPYVYEFVLAPNQTFSFHDGMLSEYQSNTIKTTNAHFNYDEGFKSDGYLFGDGVCHLASLFYWTAKDAGLSAVAPTNHDFANIPDIPKKYGVAIYDVPSQNYANAKQNLYITNNKPKPVVFHFEQNNDKISMSINLL